MSFVEPLSVDLRLKVIEFIDISFRIQYEKHQNFKYVLRCNNKEFLIEEKVKINEIFSSPLNEDTPLGCMKLIRILYGYFPLQNNERRRILFVKNFSFFCFEKFPDYSGSQKIISDKAKDKVDTMKDQTNEVSTEITEISVEKKTFNFFDWLPSREYINKVDVDFYYKVNTLNDQGVFLTLKHGRKIVLGEFEFFTNIGNLQELVSHFGKDIKILRGNLNNITDVGTLRNIQNIKMVLPFPIINNKKLETHLKDVMEMKNLRSFHLVPDTNAVSISSNVALKKVSIKVKGKKRRKKKLKKVLWNGLKFIRNNALYCLDIDMKFNNDRDVNLTKQIQNICNNFCGLKKFKCDEISQKLFVHVLSKSNIEMFECAIKEDFRKTFPKNMQISSLKQLKLLLYKSVNVNLFAFIKENLIALEDMRVVFLCRKDIMKVIEHINGIGSLLKLSIRKKLSDKEISSIFQNSNITGLSISNFPSNLCELLANTESLKYLTFSTDYKFDHKLVNGIREEYKEKEEELSKKYSNLNTYKKSVLMIKMLEKVNNVLEKCKCFFVDVKVHDLNSYPMGSKEIEKIFEMFDKSEKIKQGMVSNTTLGDHFWFKNFF